MKLHTPKLYCSYAWQDAAEPIEYVYNKYCQNPKKKAFAIGTSMGANILANMLGHQGSNALIEAACVV
jgi:predicted alpha/beta-fold hydrolase